MSRPPGTFASSAASGDHGLDAATLRELIAVIDRAWNAPPGTIHPAAVPEVVEFVIDALDAGRLRVAERQGVGRWKVNHWVKQAVLLSFRLNSSRLLQVGGVSYFDKIDSKFAGLDEAEIRASGVRTVPPAMVRHGAFLARDVVVMPSFVNIGAYVDEGTMVDGWANVGSCAQIGKRVHLSVGVCIGGVLEPVQAQPTIVEDNCFIGAHSSVVEGVIVEENSVIAMGVHLGQSTKILDRETRQISYGRVPAGSVVIAGTLPSADGTYAHRVRDHRQEGRRAEPRQDEHQRAAAFCSGCPAPLVAQPALSSRARARTRG